MWFRLKGSQRFKSELGDWVEESIISEEQDQNLSDKYGLAESPPWYKNSSFILQAMALLLGVMGLFLLIGENWEHFPTYLRMLMGFVPLAISYVLAVRYTNQGKKKESELAMIFACLAFGANIALQAQIFHISSYFPDGLLWWIIGSLSVIVYFRSSFLAIVFMGLYVVWLGYQNEYYQFSFWSIGILFVFMYLIYTKANTIMVLVSIPVWYMFVLNVMLNLEKARIFRFFEVEFYFLFVCVFILFFLSLFYWVKKDYSTEFSNRLQSILLFGIIFLFYTLTFSEASEEVISGLIRRDLPISFYAFYLIMVLLFVAQRKNIDWKELDPDLYIAFGFTTLLILISLLIPSQSNSSYEEFNLVKSRYNFDSYFMLMNLFFFVYSIWKIYFGISKERKQSFMAGIFYLAVLALSRYLTLFEDYFITAIIFISCSIGIYFINRVWDKRYGIK
jgi:uncharacterized membrane protein